MLFLVDECLPNRLCTKLTRLGHDATWASIVCRGASDDLVLARATREGRVLVSEDRDFGLLTLRFGHQSIGLVLAYVQSFPGEIDAVIDHVAQTIHDLGPSISNQFTTIEPGRVRQRPLPRAP
jgi:predicted nuclease of predicted toxin-antitoxin system